MYVYIYIFVCVHWFMHSTQNHLGGICVCETGLGSLGSSDPRLRGSKDLAHRKAPGKPHISHGRVADFIQIDAEGPHWSCIIYLHLSSSIITIILYLQPWDTVGHLTLAHQIFAHHEKGHAMNHPTPNISTWVTWHRCRASKDLRRWSIGCTSHRHWCWHWSWSEQRQLFPLGSGILGSGLTWSLHESA